MLEVIVPATSANIGPGYDCLGIALNLYNKFYFCEIEKGLIIDEKEEEYITKNGQRILKYQKVKKKQIAPDTAALIFALTNVAPYKWKNMQKIETKEIKEENDAPIYSFDDLPDDVLFKITDELQNVEQKRLEALKNGDNGEKTE